MEKLSKETLEKWNQNPKNWKFGCLYFNPEDNRIFPPKRIPWMGWTVNFANKKSVIVFVIMMTLIISVIFFIPHKKYHL